MSKAKKNIGKGKSPSINYKLSEDMVPFHLPRKIKSKMPLISMTMKKLESSIVKTWEVFWGISASQRWTENKSKMKLLQHIKTKINFLFQKF